MEKIKTAFFDLGSTLLYGKDPWLPILKDADKALVAVLREAGLPLAVNILFEDSGGFLNTYYAERGNGTYEKTASIFLKETLKDMGIQDTPDRLIRSALDSMYTITQQNWYLETDAITTLESLRRRGICLGLISNTADDVDVQQLVDRHGLRSYFDYIITSAACGIRKPDERIFQMALDHFHTQPETTIMVGDTLEADVLGANRMGMYSIWITRRVNIEGDGDLEIQPQAIISELIQIPALLTEYESTPGLQ
jgi:putative hydrolase of the HAD superfamily